MSNPITRFFSSQWRKFRAFWIIDFLTEEEQLLSSSPKQRTLDAPLLEDIDSSTSDGQSGDVWRKEGFSHTWKRLPGGFVESVELGKHPRLLCKDDAQMLADGWRKVIPPKDKVARTKFSGPGPDSHPPEPEAPLPALLPCRCGRKAELTTGRSFGDEWTFATAECPVMKENHFFGQHTPAQSCNVGPERVASASSLRHAINVAAAQWNDWICTALATEPSEDRSSQITGDVSRDRMEAALANPVFSKPNPLPSQCQCPGCKSWRARNSEPSERTHALVHQEWDAARLAAHAAQEKLRVLRLELNAIESKLLAERAEASK